MSRSPSLARSPNPALRVLRDRLARRIDGPRLIHALYFLPDPTEAVFASISRAALRGDGRPDLWIPRKGGGAIAWRSIGSSNETVPAGVSGGIRTYTLGSRVIEALGHDAAETEGIDRACAEWAKDAADLWRAVETEDLDSFRVDPAVGPSIGHASDEHWGRLLHLAAWSRMVPGLSAEIHRFNLHPEPRLVLDIRTGTPSDPIDPPTDDPVTGPFIPSKAYASVLNLDALAASLVLLDHLIGVGAPPAPGASHRGGADQGTHAADLKPSRWFDRATGGGLNAATLKMAVRRGMLEKSRQRERGKPWHHSFAEVCSVYPGWAERIQKYANES